MSPVSPLSLFTHSLHTLLFILAFLLAFLQTANAQDGANVLENEETKVASLRWTVTSAYVGTDERLEQTDLLSPASYFEFFADGHIEFRINENYPPQSGVYTQTENDAKIIANTSDCPACIHEFTISRKAKGDTVFKLSFGEYSQNFTVDAKELNKGH
jgi:hypothetical protein